MAVEKFIAFIILVFLAGGIISVMTVKELEETLDENTDELHKESSKQDDI